MLLIFALIACEPADPKDSGAGTDDTGGGGPTITAPKLVLNEVLAVNDTVNADSAGEYDDWVEIYNAGDSIVQLDGFYLTDDEAEPTMFALPTGKGIDAGGFLLVWCDGQPEQSTGNEIHSSFKLNKGGDIVYLNYAEDGQVVQADAIEWNADQTADLAAARVPDGAKNWVNQAATPAASNGG